MTTRWTFETLAQANKATLEGLMQHSAAPEIEKLSGQVYCGWNHDPIGKLTGEKFKKGFVTNRGALYGYNEVVAQDKNAYSGNWDYRNGNQRPFQMGYFLVQKEKESGERDHLLSLSVSLSFYPRAAVFNYNIPDNSWHMSFFRVLRDFIVSPNAGDHNLLLGKAYVQLWPKRPIACCYFLLGYPQPIQFMPTHFKL